MDPVTLLNIVNAALPLIEGGAAAIKAAHAGDEPAARAALAGAREAFDAASAKWDAAGKAAPAANLEGGGASG